MTTPSPRPRPRAVPGLTACLTLALSLGLAGCGDDFSNRLFEDDARFLAAAPAAQTLRIGGPVQGEGFAATALIVEEPAELYVLTRQVTLSLNGLAFGLLHAVDRLVEQVPTTRTADGRTWTLPPHPLDPLDTTFEMQRAGGRYTYALRQGRRDRDAAPLTVLSGHFEPRADGAAGTGQLTFDLDAARRLGASWGEGLVQVDYTLGDGRTELAIRLEGVRFADQPVPVDTTYRFERGPDGAGTFDFAFPLEEDGWVIMRSRWDATGAGRADALRPREGGDRRISECWDRQFARSAGSLDPQDSPLPGCAFPLPAFPDPAEIRGGAAEGP